MGSTFLGSTAWPCFSFSRPKKATLEPRSTPASLLIKISLPNGQCFFELVYSCQYHPLLALDYNCNWSFFFARLINEGFKGGNCQQGKITTPGHSLQD